MNAKNFTRRSRRSLCGSLQTVMAFRASPSQRPAENLLCPSRREATGLKFALEGKNPHVRPCRPTRTLRRPRPLEFREGLLALQPARSPMRSPEAVPPSRHLRFPMALPATTARRQIRNKTQGRQSQRKSLNTFIALSTAGSERFASESTVSARSRDSGKKKRTKNGIIYRCLQPSDITTSLVKERREPVNMSSYGFTRHTFQEQTGGMIQRPSAACGQSRDDCSGPFLFRRTRSIHSSPAWLQTTSKNSNSGSCGCIIDRGL
jgi:hypothetical protein